MRSRALALALVATLMLPLTQPIASAAPSIDIPARVAGEAVSDYIVVFKDGTNARAQAALLGEAGAKVAHVYETVFPGLAASLTQRQVRHLQRLPQVELLEQDGLAYTTDVISQSNATWGLDRIDQDAAALNSTYTYNSVAGEGVRAYVLDTGISPHPDFGSRLVAGWTPIKDGKTTDCNGHGTHVAGTIGGATYGVAKKVTLVPVRVLACGGSGTWSDIIAGLNWVAGDAAKSGKPAVANMSLGGGTADSLDAAVSSLSATVTVVVAAGNSTADACNSSPARVRAAVTVGATARSSNKDVLASYSNFGDCVDLLAPGSSIVSTSNKGKTATMSGTSMASPHVAGAAALYRSVYTSATADATAAALVSNAKPGKVTLTTSATDAGTPNLMLFANFLP